MDNLLGITAGDWWNCLKENRFAVAPRYWRRAAFLTLLSLANSTYRRKEMGQYGAQVADAKVEDPIFILGHWRTGTTLLHYLMAQDEQFTYPTIFQTLNPHTFLTREDEHHDELRHAKSRKRAMDNMRFKPVSPGEDEFATCAVSQRSPLMSWSFPQNAEYYDRFLTFREVPEEDRERWRSALLTFLQKITWKYQRPLLIKSPAHTARVRILLEMFPSARFIHIRRDPYVVFQSTQRLFDKGIPRGYLQRPPDTDSVNARILRRYVELYDAYFEDRQEISEDRLCEIRFEELEKDKLGQVRKVYEELNLPGFEKAEPAIRRYIDSVAGYKKNVHPPLEEPLRRQVADLWRRSFEAWEYPV